MSQEIEERLDRIPIIRTIVRALKCVRFKVLEGYSLYDLVELYLLGIIKGAFSYRAGSIAFSFFMALFPFALFILNLIPYIPIDNFQVDFMQFIASSVPPNTFDAIESILSDIMNNSYRSLLSSGFLLSIFLMTNGVFAIIGGFESSYHITISRNFFRQYLVALVLSVCLAVMLIFSVAFFVILEIVMYKFHINFMLIQWSRSIFLLLVVLFTTSVLYKFGAKETKQMSFISIGSVFTTILYILTSYFFGVYVLRFARYNELYGSIGTLLVVMFYLWINCMILLLGFELNLAINKLKSKK
ncbi:YihY/virulence factor BrkB family protein [Myroides marinus]|uniref:Membrane protein n=1 Tax=Myroides marinus TaxID=703342 RepID=A0A1H6VF56_9FLAO|nr:YihY/virulence factor BrkB family protein [Myroides marinus]MDM1347729.1 YihY/virulence factor BrkB family protein [Myroides marinus]MDM1351402.1 YihY/virulence factor BrkB family protein [Myroides marinus]MDM1354703.1 YihY/virulence factor BrkB family protein [Myroides marinus]MDM1358609.1 YihY/virulence factor BrkB family protein [Myroides marinus]MDM1360368.1 YihY/virulence factor BrkB family protein [Myroides marinus]